MSSRLILLTGAGGFIGSHLLPRLQTLGPVRCLVRARSRSKIPASGSLEIAEGDLLSGEGVRSAMRGVDTVVHLAALLRTSNPRDIYDTNVGGTRLLAEEARKNSVKKFLFLSTENALREDLDDAYALSKREAEKIVAPLPGSLILRPCFVYGPGDSHGLGRIVERVKKDPVVPLFGGLQSRVQPLFIDDMVEYSLRGLQKNVTGSYVLAGPDTIGLNDFMRNVAALLGKKPLFVPVPYPVFAGAAVFCDTFARSAGWGRSQLRNIYFSRTYSTDEQVRAFGWEPLRLEEGLKKWFSSFRSGLPAFRPSGSGRSRSEN